MSLQGLIAVDWLSWGLLAEIPILLFTMSIDRGHIMVLTRKASRCLLRLTADDEPLRVQCRSRAAIQCRAATQWSRYESLRSCGARLDEVWVYLYARGRFKGSDCSRLLDDVLLDVVFCFSVEAIHRLIMLVCCELWDSRQLWLARGKLLLEEQLGYLPRGSGRRIWAELRERGPMKTVTCSWLDAVLIG